MTGNVIPANGALGPPSAGRSSFDCFFSLLPSLPLLRPERSELPRLLFDRLPSDLSLLLLPTGLEVEAWGPPCLHWLSWGRRGWIRSALAPPFWAPAQLLQVGNWLCVCHFLSKSFPWPSAHPH